MLSHDADPGTVLAKLAGKDYCYLSTTGRVSGETHEIEIWFGANGSTIYLLSGSGGRSDWVKNIRKTPAVSVSIGEQRLEGNARVVSDEQEDLLARHLLAGKYQGWKEGKTLSDWARNALPVAIDIYVSS